MRPHKRLNVASLLLALLRQRRTEFFVPIFYVAAEYSEHQLAYCVRSPWLKRPVVFGRKINLPEQRLLIAIAVATAVSSLRRPLRRIPQVEPPRCWPAERDSAHYFQ